MELFRWEEGPTGKEAPDSLARIRGRIVQCAVLPLKLACALGSGGAAAQGQAASAIASLIPFGAYIALEGVYAHAEGPAGTGARLSPYARALALACEAEFLGVLPARGMPEDPFASPWLGGDAARRPPSCALVVMQGEASRQAEQEAALRLATARWIICAYVGSLCQRGSSMVI